MSRQKDIYKKLRETASKEIISFLIGCMLKSNEIRVLANRCELKYDGVRTAVIPIDILIEDLARKFLEDPNSGLNITKYLLKKIERLAPDLSSIPTMTVEQIKRKYSAKKLMNRGPEEGASVIIAMMMDSRKEINEYASRLYEKINRMLNLEDEDLADEDENHEDIEEELGEMDEIMLSLGRRIRDSDLEKMINSLKLPKGVSDDEFLKIKLPIVLATVMLRYGYDEFVRKLDEMEERVEEERRKRQVLQRKTDKLQERLIQQRHISDEIARERADLKRKVDELERKLASLSSQQKEIENLMSKCHELERENRKLKHKLMEANRISQENEELKIENTKLKAAIKTLNDQIEKERNRYREKLSELESYISTLKAQKESLARELKEKREAQQHSTSKLQKVKRDKPLVGVFVDVQNMFYAAKENYNGKLDYAKLLDVVVGERRLVTANAYVVYNPEIDQSSFISFLEHQGYKVKTKNLTVRSDGSAKGNWDVGMTIDIISMIDDLDVVVLVSGDGDFCPLVEHLQKKGISVEVFGFERNTSMELKELADAFYPLSGDMVIVD